MRRRLGAALIGAALVASGCQPGPPAPTPPAPTASAPTASATPTPTRPTDAIAWQPCLLGECGTLRVPLRHERPDAGSIELAVARVRASASPRLGTLFVNPGGPGIPGRMLARLASEIDGLEQWDVVAWDTRGVGASTALTCLNAAEEETYLTTDFSPDTPAERDALLAQERLLGQACRDRSADGLAASVSTRDSARDLDLLRAAVGESKLTYAGLSAGASLGAAYATLFPARVGRLVLDAGDLRRSVTQGRESNLILLCVDASGSMAARRRMEVVKTAVLSLLLDAYQRRDKVAMVTFRAASATVALPATSSVDVAARRLADLPHGGRTPLAEGLTASVELLRLERLRDPRRRPLLVVVTDGRATSGPDAVARAHRVAHHLRVEGVDSVVIDCETGRFRMGLAGVLATQLGAEHVPVDELGAGALVGTIRAHTEARTIRTTRKEVA